jgi:hypothetical protein
MAEKAVCIRIYSVTFENDIYELTAEYMCGDGQGGGAGPFTVAATASVFNPVLGGTWKQRLQAAIIDKAEEDANVEVDEVLFPDLSIL